MAGPPPRSLKEQRSWVILIFVVNEQCVVDSMSPEISPEAPPPYPLKEAPEASLDLAPGEQSPCLCIFVFLWSLALAL